MAWHMGHPLSQTLFTSLYIDRILTSNPKDAMHLSFETNGSSRTISLTLRVLKAYCIGVVKTCWHVNNRIKSEHFYEVCSLYLTINPNTYPSPGRRFCYPHIQQKSLRGD